MAQIVIRIFTFTCQPCLQRIATVSSNTIHENRGGHRYIVTASIRPNMVKIYENRKTKYKAILHTMRKMSLSYAVINNVVAMNAEIIDIFHCICNS